MSGRVRVQIRVKPGAARTQVGGSHAGAIVVAVRQRAVEGRATEAALVALAESVGLRRRDVQLLVGAGSRDKVVEFVDPPSDLVERLDRLKQGSSD